MKKYSSNYNRDKVVIVLIMLSLVISLVFNKYIFPCLFEPIVDFLEKNAVELYNLLLEIDWIIKPIEYIVIYEVLRNLYDNKLWKAKVFNRFNLCSMPNISGKWIGDSVSSRTNEDGQLITRYMQMDIVQSFTKIKVTCCFFSDVDRTIQTSISDNDLSGLFYDEASIGLRFVFKNRSKEVHTKSKNYMGYNEFQINTTLDEMEGDYFTGRDTGQHSGKMKLKKVLIETY